MPKDQVVTLSRRDAKVGPSINCRTQREGDAAGAKATDLSLSGIHLSADELNAMLREPLAHRALYVTRAGTKLADPLLKQIGPLSLLGKLEHAVVTLYIGVDAREIKLGICKLARRTLELKTGGMTEFSCQVQAVPTLDGRIAPLLDSMASNVQVEIDYEHNAEQADLAMTGNGDDEEDDDDDKPARAKRGRRGSPPRDEGDRAH